MRQITLVGTLLVATTAHAEVPDRIRLQIDSQCPHERQIKDELSPLLPDLRFVPDAPDSVRVSDEGASVVVEVRGHRKVFHEPERACAERARLVGVFVALTLDPPEFLLDPEPVQQSEAAIPSEQEPSERPASAPRGRLPLGLELAGWMQAGLGSSAAPLPVLGGAQLRGRFGESWGLSLGAGFSLPTTIEFPGATVNVHTLPLDLSAHVRVLRAPFEGLVELGIAAPLLWSQSEERMESTQQLRLDVGVRVGFVGRLWLTQSIAGLVGIEGALFPRPYQFVILPDEVVGETPAAWLGVKIGVALLPFATP